MLLTCLNCGVEFERRKGKGRHAKFHAPACRKEWNNRRMERGAILYDIWMQHRFDRTTAKEQNTLTIMANLARAFRDADNSKRNGRLSWDPLALKRLPLGFGTDGDRR